MKLAPNQRNNPVRSDPHLPYRTGPELARHAKDLRNESAALELLGKVAQARGDVGQAIEHYTASLRIEAELGIELGVALRHCRIGDALLQAGREPAAEAHLQTALRILTALGDDEDLAQVALGLARIGERPGHPSAALERLNMARRVLGRTGSAALKANILIALAEASEQDGHLDQARSYLTEAIDLGGAALVAAQNALAILDATACASEQEPPHEDTTGSSKKTTKGRP